MASLMETLLDVLNKENEQYEQLLKLSKEKTQIIVGGNINELNEIVDKETSFVDVVGNLEKKRIETINDIGIVLNRDVTNLKIRDIIKMLDNQPDEQKKLSIVHDKLKETLRNMTLINEKNRMLIQNAMEMNEFEVTLYQSMRKAPETANYGKDAYSTGEVLINTSGFDTKQ